MTNYDKESKARHETILLLADIQRLKGCMSSGAYDWLYHRIFTLIWRIL